MLGAWFGKLGLIAAVILTLRTWPEMPSMSRSFLLSEWLQKIAIWVMAGPRFWETGSLTCITAPKAAYLFGR